MKLQLFALSVAIVLCTSVTSYAGCGYFTEVFRNIGYFYGDGYHAQRHCLPEPHSCHHCSPMQPPMMPQPMMPQPVMRQPMMVPADSQWSSPQMQPASYPVGYPVTQGYRPWQPSRGTSYRPSATPPVAISRTR